ncbi:MAG: flagellar filament capping protein FliD [Methylobacter sp.]
MDINGIVSQLITAEGQPQFSSIDRQTTATQTRLSGLGTLKSALSNFQTAVQKLKSSTLYTATQAVSAKTDIFTATSGLGAVTGTHTVEVTKLAKAQQSTTSTEFSGLSAVASANGGTLSFTYPAGSTKTAFSVTIAANATLANVRDAINSATGNNGVTASIVNVDSTANPGTTISKLVLNAKDTGTANGFSVGVTTVDGAGTGLNLLDTSTIANFDTMSAVDAKIKVDGQTATRSSNTITDVLPGITLNLQSEAAGTSVNLGVTLDTSSISKTISDFVTAYNSLNTTSHSLGKYGGTAAGATNGALLGDATLRSITSQLRQDVSNPVTSATSSYNSLAMIGISIDKTGVMSLDTAQLTTALSANLSAVSDVFASSNGVATRLDSRLTQYLQSGGALDSQQTALNKKLASYTTQRADVQSRLDSLQAAMLKQFTAMDAVVGQMKSTATYLTQQFK